MAKLFRATRLMDIVLVVSLVVAIGVFSHFWISDRRGVLRVIYPVEALLAQVQWSCSTDSPGWMLGVLRYTTKNNGSLANQIAYVDSKNRLYHCENGWLSEPLVSEPVHEDSRFRYASVSKLFTADAILSLIKERKLTLDTSLVDVFPDIFPVKDERVKQITVRYLLQHRAGFDRLITEDPLFSLRKDKPWCPYNLAKLSEISLSFDPGSRYRYSNIGYCILGKIIEAKSGVSYRSFIKERYSLSPLGIKFVNGPYMSDEVEYDFRNAGFFDKNYSRFFDFDALSSVAGLSGSASSLAVLLKEMAVDKKSENFFSAPISGCSPQKFQDCYSYGPYLYQAKDRDLKTYIQEGYLPGASSVIFMDNFGGVLVLLTSGTPHEGYKQKKKLYSYIYEKLSMSYSVGKN